MNIHLLFYVDKPHITWLMYGSNGTDTTQTHRHTFSDSHKHTFHSPPPPFVIFGDNHGRGLAPIVMNDSQGDNTPRHAKDPLYSLLEVLHNPHPISTNTHIHTCLFCKNYILLWNVIDLLLSGHIGHSEHAGENGFQRVLRTCSMIEAVGYRKNREYGTNHSDPNGSDAAALCWSNCPV